MFKSSGRPEKLLQRHFCVLNVACSAFRNQSTRREMKVHIEATNKVKREHTQVNLTLALSLLHFDE